MWVPDSKVAAERAVESGVVFGLAKYVKHLNEVPAVSPSDRRLIEILAEEVMNSLWESGKFVPPAGAEQA